jgi:hypothetical protein
VIPTGICPSAPLEESPSAPLEESPAAAAAAAAYQHHSHCCKLTQYIMPTKRKKVPVPVSSSAPTKRRRGKKEKITPDPDLLPAAEAAVPAPKQKDKKKKDDPLISILQDVDDLKDASSLNKVMDKITAKRFSREILEKGIAWLLANPYAKIENNNVSICLFISSFL